MPTEYWYIDWDNLKNSFPSLFADPQAVQQILMYSWALADFRHVENYLGKWAFYNFAIKLYDLWFLNLFPIFNSNNELVNIKFEKTNQCIIFNAYNLYLINKTSVRNQYIDHFYNLTN